VNTGGNKRRTTVHASSNTNVPKAKKVWRKVGKQIPIATLSKTIFDLVPGLGWHCQLSLGRNLHSACTGGRQLRSYIDKGRPNRRRILSNKLERQSLPEHSQFGW
jgi:hypothetical protein